MSILLAIYSEWALLALRVFVGALFMAHGIPKLRDIGGTAAAMAAEGLRPGKLWAPLFGIVETVGGAALLAGIMSRPMAAVFAVEMLVILALRFIHKEKFIGKGGTGWELDLMLFGAVLVLMTSGGGAWQLGAWLGMFVPW